jgi:hypothetical protein
VFIQKFASVDDYANAVASYAEDPRGEVDPLVLWGVDLYEVWKSDWQDKKSLAGAFRFAVVSKVLGHNQQRPLHPDEARLFKLFGHDDALAYFAEMRLCRSAKRKSA